MKKRKIGRTLSRKSGQRKALLRTLLVSLIEHKKIKTTLAKAKELKPFAERRLTYAKKGLGDSIEKMNSIRKMKIDLPVRSIEKLFQIAEASKDRNGGYLRIVKTGNRQSDNAPMAIVEWTDSEKLIGNDNQKKEKKVTKSKEAAKEEPKEKEENKEESPENKEVKQ